MKYAAFLRAINVGGHIVKMDQLRRIFESLGFANVETFIASGNVIFNANTKKVGELERKIEAKLHQALGYEVGVFLRTIPEVVEISKCLPFSNHDATVYIALLHDEPGQESQKKLLAFSTESNELKFHEREFYWLCRTKMSDSKFSYTVLEKTLKAPATFRNVTTIRKIAAKYSSK